jgi:hypothetical protein
MLAWPLILTLLFSSHKMPCQVVPVSPLNAAPLLNSGCLDISHIGYMLLLFDANDFNVNVFVCHTPVFPHSSGIVSVCNEV